MGLDIGFIGLGRMGAPMARRLAGAGHRLHVYDVVPEAVARFAADTPCERPLTPRAVGAAAGIVITMLPEGKHVRQALFGENGVLEGLAPGSILIDMTSASPVGTRQLGAELAEKGFPLVDAPVSGGVKKAADGTLAIMVGGEPDIVERMLPILNTMGKTFLTGGPGTGHAMKAMNNYLSAGTLALSAEAVIAGSKFGLDPKVMVDILNASTGRSNSTEHKYPTFILPRTFDSGFALGLMAKDLRLAVEVSRSVHSQNTLLTELSRLYDEAEEKLGFAADNTELVKFFEALSEDDGA
jgi:3-hydroxyisobutyrate dehydrogenase